jgi:hypothetical protein
MASSIIIAFLSTLVEVLLRRAGSLVPPCVWDAAQPLAHRYAVDHDCASSNPGFRAAIANSYIRVLSPLHSALVPVQCQRAAQPSHHSGDGWLEVIKKASAIHPPVKTGGLLEQQL